MLNLGVQVESFTFDAPFTVLLQCRMNGAIFAMRGNVENLEHVAFRFSKQLNTQKS
jgi:hypothetical protein